MKLRIFVARFILLCIIVTPFVICVLMGRLDDLFKLLFLAAVFFTPMITGSVFIFRRFQEWRAVLLWAGLVGVSLFFTFLASVPFEPRAQSYSWGYIIVVSASIGLCAFLLITIGTAFYTSLLKAIFQRK